MPKKKPTKVYRYDGQSIWTSSDSGYLSYSDYELGSYLGGGAAGEVYEAECFKTKRVSLTYECHIHMPGISYIGLSCLLYTSPSPRDGLLSRMPSSA